MTGAAVQRIEAALKAKGLRGRGSSWQCPAHKDRRPSLSVGAGEGGRNAVITCHTGCETGEVMAALGLTLADLFDEPRPEKTVEAVYPYRDADGRLLFEKLRLVGKEFRYRHLDPLSPDAKQDGYVTGIGPTRARPLYRLPEVIAAVARGETVWFAEGEKDVHALVRAGVCATTIPNGAAQKDHKPVRWRDEWSAPLAGARVVVVADRDEPGRRHAAHLAACLRPVVESVEVVEAVQGKDAHDALEVHDLDVDDAFAPAGTAVEAEDVESPAGLVVETWPVFRRSATDAVSALVEDVWPVGAMGFIASAPKRGKTWVALLLALAVASGRPFLGRHRVPVPRGVLYVALEGSRAGLRARVGALARGMGLDPDGGDLDRLRFVYRPLGMNLSDPRWAGQLVEAAAAVDAGLVVVDVLRRAATIRETGEGAQDFAVMLRNLGQLEADDRALALCHHFTKTTADTGKRLTPERMAGSGALYGALDAGLFITRSENGARELFVEVEARDLRAPAPFGVQITGTGTGPNGGFTYADTARVELGGDIGRPEVDVIAEQLVAVLAVDPGITQTAAAARLGMTRDRTVFRSAWEVAKNGGAGRGGVASKDAPPDPHAGNGRSNGGAR